jgi:hypothetical protein
MAGELMATTPYMMQIAMNEELKQLFDGKKFCGQEGLKALRFFEQELPIDVEGDAEADVDMAYAPYVVTKISAFDSPVGDKPLGVELALIICAFDLSNARQGYRDVLNIATDIVQHFRAMPTFGKCCTVDGEINVAMSDDDIHPYYFASVRMDCTTHNMTMDQTLEDMV